MINQVNGILAPAGPQAPSKAAAPAAGDFRAALEGAMRPDTDVRLSLHARERLRERNIVLADADMRRISAAADKLASKGGRDALVVMDKVGLILDVPRRTVVTAIERQRLGENVFTNIDSAIFA
jgi:flagellar operon protein